MIKRDLRCPESVKGKAKPKDYESNKAMHVGHVSTREAPRAPQ